MQTIERKQPTTQEPLDKRVIKSRSAKKSLFQKLLRNTGIFVSAFIMFVVIVAFTTDLKFSSLADWTALGLTFFVLLFCSYSMYLNCSDSGTKAGKESGTFLDAQDDYDTRERFIYPYKEQSTFSTVDFLKRALVYFGYLPAIIQTDNGTEFTPPKNAKETTVNAVDRFLTKYGIRHKLIKPYTPRHNGKVERSHRTDQECFYNHLQYSTFEELKEKMADWLNRYNNRPHSSLRNREGKRAWLTPLQKRAELMEDYKKNGFKDENDKEIKIRFLKRAA